MDFDSLIAQRMARFPVLLNHAQFDYKEYQRYGIEWCIRNELRPLTNGFGANGVRGGFIADEMGLGKTLTVIGAMFCNFLPHTLIVVPPILLTQWFNEILKMSGHRALCYYGQKKATITMEQLEKAPIILTTYNTLLPDDCVLKLRGWNRVVFDEAHHLRNARTRRYRSCKQIQARVRWLVTGTPIQNKKHDFLNLAAIIGLKTVDKAYILRRTKAEVGIEMPALQNHNCVVEWGSQKEMLLSEELHALLPGQTGVDSDKRRQLAERLGPGGALLAMLRARQSCILPELMRTNVKRLVDSMCRDEYMDALNHCSKLDAVMETMISRKDNGKGKIVFCHYKQEIDTIAKRLLAAGFVKVVCCDGRSTARVKRMLKEPADALIIQIQTGCEGLNLQEHFSEVYFVSPHWNPSVEDQAIARCHRLGQQKQVDIFKFEMKGFKEKTVTVDKYINHVQDLKRSIGKEILDV
jgi:SNF2 family DNA or RNA helicase